MYGGYSRQLAVLSVEFQQLADVDVRNPVSIREHYFVGVYIGLDSFHPCPGHGAYPRVGERDRPVLRFTIALDEWLLSAFETKSKSARRKPIVKKVLLDHFSFVAQTKNKALESVRSIHLHDVPQD